MYVYDAYLPACEFIDHGDDVNDQCRRMTSSQEKTQYYKNKIPFVLTYSVSQLVSLSVSQSLFFVSLFCSHSHSHTYIYKILIFHQ